MLNVMDDSRDERQCSEPRVSVEVVDDARRRKLMAKLASGAFVAPVILLTLGAGPAAAS
jgi:hypothetical protein